MSFDPVTAERRFGMGLSPKVAPPASADDMLSRLSGPDHAADRFVIPTYSDVFPSPLDYREVSLALRDATTDAETEAAEARRSDLREAGRAAVAHFIKMHLARDVATEDGFRERLTRFWADHFTVRAGSGNTRHLVSPYIEEAIRPHVAGSFADMLVAVVGSPMMIRYLDQHLSMGPNSQTAQRRDRGLNENLAREVLELHTLGVGGAYSQTDVRQLAELLTGVTANHNGAFFRVQNAEPGAETVLGKTYGGAEESLDHVVSALRDLARHPDTARHLASKLWDHFVGGEPDSGVIDAMATQYLLTDGQLMSFYEVMLSSDAVWSASPQKVLQPYDFISSSMRALAVPPATIEAATLQDVRRLVQRPLAVMGQSWQAPVGPDGWSEAPEDWITPQGMAGRITWAMQAPRQMLDDLPDPRDFVTHALGARPPDPVVFAAGAAETVSDGIGVILASAAFQRR